MKFRASKSQPCSYCNVMIERGTDENITWDRVNSGYIHLTCMTRRRNEKAPALPAPVITTTATPIPMSNGNGHGNDTETANALAKLIQSLAGQRGIDETAVRRIAADEAAKVSVNRSLNVRVNDMPPVKLDLAHRDIHSLLKLASTYDQKGHRLNIWLYGPAGSGKSTAAHQVSNVLFADREENERYGYISLNPQTPDSRIMGYMDANGKYVGTAFERCYVKGGLYCFDEIDNAASALVTTLNGCLENGHAAFPYGVAKRHPDFICIVTGNTIGLGGDIHYPERRALDSAFRDRFHFLEWGYDLNLTKAIIGGILGTNAPEFMAWVDREAESWQARYPTMIVSPRSYIHGAVLEKIGFTRNQIIPMAITRGIK